MPSINIKLRGDVIGTVDFEWDDQSEWLIQRVKVRVFIQPFAEELRQIIKNNPDGVNSVGGHVEPKGAQINYEVLFVALDMWSERRKTTSMEAPVPLGDMPNSLANPPSVGRDY